MSIIAIIGKKNVGKSILFNKLTKTKDALVNNIPGFTIDKKYGVINSNRDNHIIIDTPYLDCINKYDQIIPLIGEVNMILYVLDAQFNILNEEIKIINKLRKDFKKLILIVNKIDKLKDKSLYINNLNFLGRNIICLISAIHNLGINNLFTEINSLFIKENQESKKTLLFNKLNCINTVIVGRPNVGKSTFINYLLGEKRLSVSNYKGTTKDSISVYIRREKNNYIFTDTSGIVKSKNNNSITLVMIKKILKIVRRSDLTMIMFNIKEKIVRNDLYIVSLVNKYAKAFILVFNQIDKISKNKVKKIKEEMIYKLKFINSNNIYFISSKLGIGIDNLINQINKSYKELNKKISINLLYSLIKEINKKYFFSKFGKSFSRIKFISLNQINPINITIYTNLKECIKSNYISYIKNELKKELKIKEAVINVNLKKC